MWGWVIIYLWQGERYRGDTYRTADEAHDVVSQMRRDGWQAWTERVWMKEGN
jgi:hypothetical protein